MLEGTDRADCIFSQHALLFLSSLLLPRHREVRKVAIKPGHQVHVRHRNESGLILWQIDKVTYSFAEDILDLRHFDSFKALTLRKVRV
jgi:hypothetical protein